MTALAPTLQTFLTDYLTRQRKASPHTIAAYRDAIKLLLVFTAKSTGKQPHQLDIADLDAPLIVAFLDHLEHDRHNTTRTRNARLAAIQSLYHYAGLRHPEHAALIARVLAIPTKRAEKPIVTFLTEDELDALLAAPDRSTWTGRRDHAIILLGRPDRTARGRADHARLRRHPPRDRRPRQLPGKGRKHRITPLIPVTVATIKVWLAERAGQPTDPLFPTRQGRRLSHDALERRIAKHASSRQPRLPLAAEQEDHPAHPAAHRRRPAAASPGRHRHDRALARPRKRPDDADLPARRPHPQTTRDRPHHPTRHQARPLPPNRPAARVPRRPLTHRAIPTDTPHALCRHHGHQPPAHKRSGRSSRHNQRIGIVLLIPKSE